MKGSQRASINALMASIAVNSARCGLALKRRNWGKTAAGRALVDAVLYPADIYKVVTQYKDTFGHYPRLLRPRTFNEWLQTGKLLRRRKRYKQFADKLRVREFVRERVGEEVLTKIYWSGTDITHARRVHLPAKFVVKSNHGSGMNLIVTDGDKFDWDEARKVTYEWMNTDYSTGRAEWQYRWIEPQILIEEFLEGPGGNIPIDYKFFCFQGHAGLIQVDIDRFTKHTRAILDREFSRLPVTLEYPSVERDVPRPECLDEMVRVAEALSDGEPFVRVDLYDVGRPVFGEVTLHPEAGIGKFSPSEWDQRIFNLLKRERSTKKLSEQIPRSVGT
jgi:hypothetical protein